jgi:hypothetical protein
LRDSGGIRTFLRQVKHRERAAVGDCGGLASVAVGLLAGM